MNGIIPLKNAGGYREKYGGITLIGAILMAAAALAAWGYVAQLPEKIPEEKVTGTGVVEQALSADGATRYVIRFTGEKNRSYLAKTAGYTGRTGKYREGKLVHIRYWFGKKGKAGAEILDQELTAVPQKQGNRLLLIASALLMISGILLLIIL